MKCVDPFSHLQSETCNLFVRLGAGLQGASKWEDAIGLMALAQHKGLQIFGCRLCRGSCLESLDPTPSQGWALKTHPKPYVLEGLRVADWLVRCS